MFLVKTKIFKGKKKKGDKIIGFVPKLTRDGTVKLKKKSFRKYKSLPEGCKAAKRICIICLKNSIHKNDSNYESKICKDCSSLPR